MDNPTYTFTYYDRAKEVDITLHHATDLREVLDGVQNFLQAVGFVFAIGDRLEMVDDEWLAAEKERPDLWADFMEEEKA